jgi:hypothetical protein
VKDTWFRSAQWIEEAVGAAVGQDDAALDRIAQEIRDFLSDYPAPGWAQTRDWSRSQDLSLSHRIGVSHH